MVHVVVVSLMVGNIIHSISMIIFNEANSCHMKIIYQEILISSFIHDFFYNWLFENGKKGGGEGARLPKVHFVRITLPYIFQMH